MRINEEENELIHNMVMKDLVGEEFNGTHATGFFDKAFSSIKLFRALADRGIHAVGMARASRPAKLMQAAKHYWPFRSCTAKESEEFEN